MKIQNVKTQFLQGKTNKTTNNKRTDRAVSKTSWLSEPKSNFVSVLLTAADLKTTIASQKAEIIKYDVSINLNSNSW